MTSSASRAVIALATVSAFLLTACGGGGGNESTVQTDPPGTTAVIKLANASDVGAQAYLAIQDVNRQIFNIITVANTISGSSLPDPHAACPYGGTETPTVTNDTIKLVDVGCVKGRLLDSIDLSFDGTTTINLSNVNGTRSATTAWNGHLDVAFSNVTVTLTLINGSNTSINVGSMNGNLAIDYEQKQSSGGVVKNFTASSNSLQLPSSLYSPVTGRTITATNLHGSIGVSPPDTFGTDNIVVSGKSSNLGNFTYAVKTTTDFLQAGDYPSQGNMTVTASDNSSLTFKVIDTSNLELKVDRNDGKINSPQTVAWSDLAKHF